MSGVHGFVTFGIEEIGQAVQVIAGDRYNVREPVVQTKVSFRYNVRDAVVQTQEAVNPRLGGVMEGRWSWDGERGSAVTKLPGWVL